MQGATFNFNQHEAEIIGFLAEHFDKESDFLGVDALPGFEKLDVGEMTSILNRFARFGLISRIPPKHVKILPKILSVAEQLRKPPSQDAVVGGQPVTAATGVFIGWSKKHSHDVALAMKGLLETVIPGVKAWESSRGIEKGTQWFPELMKSLEDYRLCIQCLTPTSEDAWIHFEVGVIFSKYHMSENHKSRVLICPFLVGRGA